MTPLASTLKDRFVQSLFTSLPATLRGWGTEPTLRVGCEAFVDILWERLDDRELAELFLGWCPAPGAVWRDYLTKLIELDADRKILAGIRFRGGDLGRPFVEVLADFPVTRPEDLVAIRRALRPAFEVFAPGCFRLWFFEEPPEVPDGRITCDQTYFVGRMGDMLLSPRPSQADRLELRVPASTAYYGKYKRTYEAFREKAPAMADAVRLGTLEDLEGCREAGVLFEAWVGDRWAGLIAADEDTFFGLPGIHLREEILHPDFHGQGLGAALQRTFIERLNHEPSCLVLGTIHGINEPSRRTALRNGRMPLFTVFFLEL